MLITKELLEDLYIKQDLRQSEVAEIIGWSKSKTYRILKNYNIIKSDEAKRERKKRTCLKLYGGPAPACNKEVINRMQTTSLRRHGVKNVVYLPKYRKQSSDRLRDRWKSGVQGEMIRKTSLERYGVENYTQTSEYKQYARSKEYQQKRINSLKSHNTFTTSKPQKEIENLLRQKFQDLKIEYYSERYPWNCDFYIPSLDLFIEYQGTWQHGKKPYDKKDPKCCSIVEKWLEGSKRLGITTSKKRNAYDYAIKVYTQEDPKKRQWAKEHNLNWKEFFTVEEVREWSTNVN